MAEKYIDRNALLKSLFSDEPAAMEDYYYNAISSFQSSDVAPVIHAKWIHDGQRVKGGVDWYHCSNCLSPESGVYVHRPYCSWCGAKMDLDKQEIDNSPRLKPGDSRLNDHCLQEQV